MDLKFQFKNQTFRQNTLISMRQVTATLWGLITSLVLSRALSICSLFIFSSVTGPEPFAPYGAYMAIVTILWVGVSGCYEQAIMVASPLEAPRLAWLAALIAAAVVLATFGICAALTVVRAPIPGGLAEIPFVMICIPIALSLRAANRLVVIFATREGEFQAIAQSNWLQAAVQGSAQLSLLMTNVSYISCLVIADIAGLLVVTLLIAKRSVAIRSTLTVRPTAKELASVAMEWRVMPQWRLPMSFISVIAVSLPSLTIPLIYPAALAGQLIFAMRVLELPSNLITGATTPLLQRQLALADNSQWLPRRAAWILVGSTCLIFSAVGALAISLEPLFEGTRWQESIQAAPWVIPYFIGLTISAPLVGTVIGHSVERISTIYQALFLILSLFSVALMSIGFDWELSLLTFGLSMIIRALLFIKLYR